jgi:hypothetical protein
MKKLFSIFFISAALIVLSAASVYACRCRIDPEETNTEEKFRRTIARFVDAADFVFAGTPVEAENNRLRFKVENVWKGDFKERITFYVNQDYLNSCWFDFEIGKSYLIYANIAVEGFYASKCGRTSFLDKARRDVEELNRSKPPAENPISRTFFSESSTQSSLRSRGSCPDFQALNN